MNPGLRIGLAVAILIGDFITFMVPLGSCLIGYVLIVRPAWWLHWWKEVYQDA